MGHETQVKRPATGQEYAALRQTGTSHLRAQVELGLAAGQARRMERAFRARAVSGLGDIQLPRFARHDAHVAAVMREGGFCALSERRVGKDGMAVCLPLTWPK